MALSHSPTLAHPNDLLLYVDAANTKIPRIGNTTLTENGGVSAPSGGYYTFDGTDDGYSISNSVYNQTYAGKTVIVAARMSTSFGSPNLFRAMIGSNGGRNFNFYIYRDGTGFRFHYSTGSGTLSGSYSSFLNISLNSWFIGAVTETTGGSVSYYLNGLPAGTASHTFFQYVSGTTEYLGRGDNFWNGDIAYWMVYKRTLTPQEIQQNYNALKGRFQ